ncbi:hypothetical protein AC622_01490 [Bacillus sp. FJAT-27916]|uniref:hypothetical protein n=1 Tax=Bacillaceae TaxID=186817 RepID=UPI0006717A25|nr:hypothetical protein [Bacillus sp. FJAT-27916]KMY43089.1 hypothetical protein AC622_01490 [Bacillus sp. FJAT-27916]
MDNYKKVDVNPEHLKYVERLQRLICERLGTEPLSEYEKPETMVEQALFVYIDIMEKYYRLDEAEWDEFAKQCAGVTDAPRDFKDFKEIASEVHELLIK